MFIGRAGLGGVQYTVGLLKGSVGWCTVHGWFVEGLGTGLGGVQYVVGLLKGWGLGWVVYSARLVC